MTDHLVSREATGSRGRYVTKRNGDEAELTFSVSTPTLVVAIHTGVPDSFRGAGVAMVAQLVADARAEGFKIVPQCPFVNAQRLRHPEWADAFSA